MIAGLKRGFEKAIKEAEKKGFVEAKKEDILEILRLRFGNVVDEMKDRISDLDDVDKLNEIFRKAVTAKDMEEFEEKLKRII